MRRLFGMLRVLGLATVLFGFVSLMTIHRAHATFKELLGGFGQQIAATGAFSPHSAPRKLFVNGLEFNVMTVSTPIDVTEALDRFQGVCHSAAQAELPLQVRKRLGTSEGSSAVDRAGMIRQEAESDGFFACLDVGDGTTGERLLERLIAFGKTLNLRSLGALRYVLARRSGDVTTLVVLWTEGDAKLGELFPKNADAPGRDLEGLPRPMHGRRLLSAFEQGKPFGFAAYRVEGQSKAAVLVSYHAALRKQGWQLRTAPGSLSMAERDGRKALVQVSETRAGAVVVHLSDLG